MDNSSICIEDFRNETEFYTLFQLIPKGMYHTNYNNTLLYKNVD